MKYEKKEWTVEDKRQMDIAAESARTELKNWIGEDPDPTRRETLVTITNWMRGWKEKAGVKRLAKVLIATGNQIEVEDEEEG